MSSDGRVGMQNIYRSAKYREKAERFSSTHIKNKLLKVLGALDFCSLEIELMVSLVGFSFMFFLFL